MQRSTKVDPTSYTEDLTLTDYYPGFELAAIPVITGILLVALVASMTSKSDIGGTTLNFFRMKALGLL